ncbi:PREDICTED: neuroparsin-A-like [Dufourea novaeangliae]|uniref:neuroparsin-A-like n=1 Tax=Dufourea novaeangliae TaxID=178035 RepID=UPI00076703B7|nr:PREDICTED: neuroparsin-A-like [Dufourea novaeangliae]
MPAIQTVYVAVLLVIVLLFDKCFGYPSNKLGQEVLHNCQSCGDSCNKCKFGVTTMPFCGRVCAKGLNEVCGGPKDSWGICGDGMYCNCNRCHGCSTKGLDCKDQITTKNTCVPKPKKLLRAFQFL